MPQRRETHEMVDLKAYCGFLGTHGCEGACVQRVRITLKCEWTWLRMVRVSLLCVPSVPEGMQAVTLQPNGPPRGTCE